MENVRNDRCWGVRTLAGGIMPPATGGRPRFVSGAGWHLLGGLRAAGEAHVGATIHGRSAARATASCWPRLEARSGKVTALATDGRQCNTQAALIHTAQPDDGLLGVCYVDAVKVSLVTARRVPECNWTV